MLFQVKNLACRRGMRPVFRDVAFALDGGAALLVTGPNGSGKSSLLRALAGLLPAFKGEFFWQDKALDWDQHRARLHYVGHEDAIKPELTLAEMLDYWQSLRRSSASLSGLLEASGLEAFRDRTGRSLSAGQRRRLALARLAADEAPLWLLDEPATSLDAAGQELLTGLMTKQRARGGIVIVATHHGIDLGGAQHLSLAEGAS